MTAATRVRRFRSVEQHHDADLGRTWLILWDAECSCYTVELDGDPLDSFDSLAEARAAVYAHRRAFTED